MTTPRHLLPALGLLAALLLLAARPEPAPAYIGGPPASLGMMCHWSTHAIQAEVEKLDREKGIIIWRKLKDYKGKWPGGDRVKQVFPNQPGWSAVLQWADVGKKTVIFALESYKWSHTYVDGVWYASNTGDWQQWSVSHMEPIVLRTYCGRTEKLQAAVGAILAGREVVVPCLSDGPRRTWRRARPRCSASGPA